LIDERRDDEEDHLLLPFFIEDLEQPEYVKDARMRPFGVVHKPPGISICRRKLCERVLSIQFRYPPIVPEYMS